jgi:cell cycle serine/threonine-protein kinase CDC5/MSD2
MQKLYGEHDYTFIDNKRTTAMDFVIKYLRLKHGILFRLSNNVIQVMHRLTRHSIILTRLLV